MGTIYRAYCEKCDRGTTARADWKGFAGCVTSYDGTGGGTLHTGYWLAVLTDGGDIVPLPHPIEDSTLRQLGYKWKEVAHRGRLLGITNVVCLSCGTLNEARRITVSGDYGCLTGLLGGAVCFLLLKTFTGMAFPLVLLTSYLVLFSPWVVVPLWLRWRYNERQASLALRNCTKCGSTKFVPLSRATKAIHKCPRCGELSMRYSIAGRS